MKTKWLRAGLAGLFLLACGCAPKPVPAPPPSPPPAPPPTPPPKLSVVVILPDPDGKPGGIAVANSAGAQTLTEPYQAVRVESSSVAPTAPFAMDQAEVRRVFGAVLDALPSPEVSFTLYFDLNSDTLTPDSQAQLQVILNTIQERRSTAISVIGHTDTTGDPRSNEALGLRRAEAAAAILRGQ